MTSTHRTSEPHNLGVPLPSNESRFDVTVIVPFYNEEKYIERTLQSLLLQETRPARILLVDNNSTDRSVALCEKLISDGAYGAVDIIREMTPGKIQALRKGAAESKTTFTAFCDADTIYPPHYFKLASQMFAACDEQLDAVMGIGLTHEPSSLASRFARLKNVLVGRLLARQCHTGGYAQIFRTNVYHDIGGYDFALWPYVLEDHEIMNRFFAVGRSAYHKDLWCITSDRRLNRDDVSWTLAERLLYHVTPFVLKNWYFYKFLGPRLQRRDLMNTNLREKPWDTHKS